MEDEALAQAVENVTAAEANVGAAEQTIANNKQKVKDLSAEKKTAKTNHDAAKKYLNGLTADAEPATVEEAEGAVTGWESEHNRLTADLDAARNAVKSAQEFAKTAKAELREAKKKPSRLPRSPAAASPRSSARSATASSVPAPAPFRKPCGRSLTPRRPSSDTHRHSVTCSTKQLPRISRRLRSRPATLTGASSTALPVASSRRSSSPSGRPRPKPRLLKAEPAPAPAG